MLPSYTQLGMAALLPHSTLKHSPDAKTVLADDQPTNGTAFRGKILESVGGSAIQAEDFKALSADERRELYKANRVLYVYHNRIDATGDKPGTERQVFEAVEDTLRDIVDLVKKLASANATNIFITADHGFLFQDEALADSFFLSTQPQGDDIKVINRRYVLGHGLKVDIAFTTFNSVQLGLDSDLEVQIPKSIHRLRLAGGGSRFVHGGATLQEIVVPVLAVNKKRKSDTRLVNVEVWPESDKITTGQVVVRLFQSEPVSEKVQPRMVRAGLYVGETLISNQIELTFDQTSTDKRDRYQSAHMLLSQDANDYNNRAVEFRLEERIPNTNQWRVYAKAMYTLKRSFAIGLRLLKECSNGPTPRAASACGSGTRASGARARRRRGAWRLPSVGPEPARHRSRPCPRSPPPRASSRARRSRRPSTPRRGPATGPAPRAAAAWPAAGERRPSTTAAIVSARIFTDLLAVVAQLDPHHERLARPNRGGSTSNSRPPAELRRAAVHLGASKPASPPGAVTFVSSAVKVRAGGGVGAVTDAGGRARPSAAHRAVATRACRRRVARALERVARFDEARRRLRELAAGHLLLPFCGRSRRPPAATRRRSRAERRPRVAGSAVAASSACALKTLLSRVAELGRGRVRASISSTFESSRHAPSLSLASSSRVASATARSSSSIRFRAALMMPRASGLPGASLSTPCASLTAAA